MQHHYKVNIKWTGNQGKGTLSYKSYNRNHTISAKGKSVDIKASSDPSFLGDNKRYNPEELFLSSLSACHMLWYLHLCSEHNIVVTAYEDQATGTMDVFKNGSGQFKEVCLHPKVIIENEQMIDKANALHHQANEMCFIANSCNFEIKHEPRAEVCN